MEAMFLLPKSDVPSTSSTQTVFSDHKFLPDFQFEQGIMRQISRDKCSNERWNRVLNEEEKKSANDQVCYDVTHCKISGRISRWEYSIVDTTVNVGDDDRTY